MAKLLLVNILISNLKTRGLDYKKSSLPLAIIGCTFGFLQITKTAKADTPDIRHRIYIQEVSFESNICLFET